MDIQPVNYVSRGIRDDSRTAAPRICPRETRERLSAELKSRDRAEYNLYVQVCGGEFQNECYTGTISPALKTCGRCARVFKNRPA